MDVYTITLPDGARNAIVADQAFIDQHYPGAVPLPQPESPGAEPAPAPRRVTRLAFRNRFTLAEKAALEFAALDDPAAPMEQRHQAAALRAQQKDTETATYIDLDNPDTRAGVQMLEAAGLLAAGRAAQILDAPVADTEAWQP